MKMVGQRETMDCEKYEPLLLDELYEELDELTSAAVRRHVAGCARCTSILNGMRATRRAVTLPLVPLPDGLEERILTAAREAQKVTPLKDRMARVLSIAGSWAMRPQTAMAAVFLLMIGTSALLIRSKNIAREGAVAISVAGDPSPVAAQSAQAEAIDDKAAAAAHGPTPPNVMRPPPPPAPAIAMAEGDELAGAVGKPKEEKALDRSDPWGSGGGGRAPRAVPTSTSTPLASIANATAPGGAPDSDDGYAQTPTKAGAISKRSGPADKEAQDPFSLGAAAFRTRNYAEATRQFDLAAQSGDPNAALWAAESTREGQGCAVALGRFDQLATKSAGSWVGNEASLRAARCQMAMNQLDSARERLNRLSQAPSHAQAAQQALAELNQVAGRKSGGGAAGGAVAAPKRATAPAAAPPAPARAPAEQKKDRSDVGY
jgi:hypothetical protein